MRPPIFSEIELLPLTSTRAASDFTCPVLEVRRVTPVVLKVRWRRLLVGAVLWRRGADELGWCVAALLLMRICSSDECASAQGLTDVAHT